MFLLPMIPAAFFFTFLDSKAIVAGPLKGFDTKFGGAFAAYFAVLLLTISTFPLWKPAAEAPEVWTVDGTVFDDHNQPLQLLSDGDIKVYPAPIPQPLNGHFTLTVTAFPQQGLYPTIYINHGLMTGPQITLDPSEKNSVVIERDSARKLIKLKQVRLNAPTPYRPTAIPTPLASGQIGVGP